MRAMVAELAIEEKSAKVCRKMCKSRKIQSPSERGTQTSGRRGR